MPAPFTSFPIPTVTGPTGSNPTATAGPNVNNGSATTFMRSDASPAVQLGSAAQKGVVQVDGTSLAAASGVLSINWPEKAPDGTVGAPSYSWTNNTDTGFYRNTSFDIRFSVNGVDVTKWQKAVFDAGGSNVVIGNQATFFYPTGTTGAGATGVTIKTNRIQVGTEALQGTQGAQSPVSWVNTYQPAAMELSSVGITSQIGGFPITAATRSSDYRTGVGGVTGGSGCYFFALNDDTGAGGPIVSATNNTGWRASGCTGFTEAMQVDIENLGSVVDISAYAISEPGETIALNITCGAFSASTNQATAAITIGTGGGTNARFRKGIVFENTGLDTGLGVAGVAMELARGQTIQWVNSLGGLEGDLFSQSDGQLHAGSSLIVNGGNLGYGTGVGGTVTQLTSISTAVTINKICGQITCVSNAFTGGVLAAFTVNNSLVAATDTVIVNGNPQGGIVYAANVTGGSFVMNIYPTSSGTSTFIINFAVIKAVTS